MFLFHLKSTTDCLPQHCAESVSFAESHLFVFFYPLVFFLPGKMRNLKDSCCNISQAFIAQTTTEHEWWWKPGLNNLTQIAENLHIILANLSFQIFFYKSQYHIGSKWTRTLNPRSVLPRSFSISTDKRDTVFKTERTASIFAMLLTGLYTCTHLLKSVFQMRIISFRQFMALMRFN